MQEWQLTSYYSETTGFEIYDLVDTDYQFNQM